MSDRRIYIYIFIGIGICINNSVYLLKYIDYIGFNTIQIIDERIKATTQRKKKLYFGSRYLYLYATKGCLSIGSLLHTKIKYIYVFG